MTPIDLDAVEAEAKAAALTYSSGSGAVELDAEEFLALIAELRALRAEHAESAARVEALTKALEVVADVANRATDPDHKRAVLWRGLTECFLVADAALAALKPSAAKTEPEREHVYTGEPCWCRDKKKRKPRAAKETT